MQLDAKQIAALEKLVKKRIEFIVFDTRRPKAKIKGYRYVKGQRIPIYGGHKIEDDTGDLRRSIKQASGFIKNTSRGLKIELNTVKYFKYLDDGRRDELNWYLTEAIFEDKIIRNKLRELFIDTGKRAILKVLSNLD